MVLETLAVDEMAAKLAEKLATLAAHGKDPADEVTGTASTTERCFAMPTGRSNGSRRRCTASTRPGPSLSRLSGWAVACLAQRTWNPTGNCSAMGSMRSRRFRRAVGTSGSTMTPILARSVRWPPGGADSSSRSIDSTRGSSAFRRARRTAWTRSSVCYSRWRGKHWSTRVSLPIR